MTTDVDLNLLRVLDALLEEGSVARAAVRLHLSAPAVSRSLGRLRRALDDPLFVRSGRGLVPTPFALSMQPQVRDALDQAVAVLSPAQETFDPSQLDRVFRISAGDAIVASLGQPLVTLLQQTAPGVQVTFLPDTNEAELLRSDGVDLDLGSPDGLGSEVEHEVLFTGRFIAAMRVDHPLASGFTTKQYAGADHISVSSKGRRHGQVDRVLDDLGLERKSITVVASFVVAAHMAATSDAIVTMPSGVVQAVDRNLPIVAVDLPFELPALPVTQSWHHRYSTDPAHRWLRSQIRAVAAPVVAARERRGE